MALELDDGVPVPGNNPDYKLLVEAYSKMEIGQCVTFTGSHTYIHSLATLCEIRIKVRAIEGKIATRGHKQYRIWRIK